MPAFFDIQGIQSAAHGERGIARYLTELALALEHSHPESVARYLLDPHLAVPGSIEPLAASGRLTFTDRIDPNDASVYHVGSPFEYIQIDRVWPRIAHRAGMRLVVTLYDLIPKLFPEIYLQHPEVNVWYRTRLSLLRRADRVLAISQATADDAVEQLGLPEERIVVVGAGVSERFHVPEDRMLCWGRYAEDCRGWRLATCSTPAGSSPGRTSTGCSRHTPGCPLLCGLAISSWSSAAF